MAVNSFQKKSHRSEGNRIEIDWLMVSSSHLNEVRNWNVLSGEHINHCLEDRMKRERQVISCWTFDSLHVHQNRKEDLATQKAKELRGIRAESIYGRRRQRQC